MFLDDIARLLTDGGFGDNLYIGKFLSTSPASSVVIIPYPGQAPVRSSGGIAYESPKMQIQVRESDYQAANVTMERVKQYMDGIANQMISATNYYWIEVLGEPFHLKDDELGRPIFACNFEVKKARTTLA